MKTLTRKQIEAKTDALKVEQQKLEIRVDAIDNMTSIDVETENEYYGAVQRIRSISRELFELSKPRPSICHHTAALVAANID
jgi:hypothetical protein